MSEVHLYLLRADFLLGEERRVYMAEQVKAQVLRQAQFLLQIGKDMRHSGQRHRLGLVFERAEDVVGFREPDSSPYFMVE